jgi:hypothetical protein
MNTPKFHTPWAAAKYANTRCRRLPGSRATATAPRQMFRPSASRGSNWWALIAGGGE